MRLISVATSFAFITILIFAWRLLNWVWLRPKKLEKCLRQQGLTGNSYKLLHGDFRQMSRMIKEANSRPISLSDDIVQRVQPFFDHSIKKYGMKMNYSLKYIRAIFSEELFHGTFLISFFFLFYFFLRLKFPSSILLVERNWPIFLVLLQVYISK